MSYSNDDPKWQETGEITRVVIVNVLGLTIDRGELADDTDLFNLGMDSLSVVRLVVALEEELGVQVPAEEMSAELFHRLGDLLAFLHAMRVERSAA